MQLEAGCKAIVAPPYLCAPDGKLEGGFGTECPAGRPAHLGSTNWRGAASVIERFLDGLCACVARGPRDLTTASRAR